MKESRKPAAPGPLSDIAAALMLLTRLPVPFAAAPRPAAAWAWPVAGAVVGAVAGLCGLVALWVGLPPALAAGVVLTAQVLATGGLHEDGLADTFDGLWGGRTPARRLEIMRDSRIGSYGVIALILSFGLRWQALTVLAAAGALIEAAILAAMVSRVPMAALMAALPPARSDGLSQLVGQPGPSTVWIGAMIAAGVILLVWPVAALPTLVLAALPAIWLGLQAKRALGGQTGDVLGASQQLAEVAVLAGLAALAV